MNEEELKELCLCGETTKVQFKREFTSQKEVAKEMIAFANSKGGVILFGVEDKVGKLVGLSYEQIQQISRELGNTAQEQVRPTIYISVRIRKNLNALLSSKLWSLQETILETPTIWTVVTSQEPCPGCLRKAWHS